MNAGHPPPQQRISSRSSSGAKRPGGGPWPLRAQIAWCALVVCLLGSMALQVRQALIDVHSLCVGTDCEGAHLSAPQVHALHHAGISVDIYGAYVAAMI